MRLLAVPLALALLTACGGDGDTAEVSVADEVGCTSLEPKDTEELYVSELHTCEHDDGESTSVYVFASSDARDSWREIAEELGAVVLSEGDTWLEVK